MEIQESLSRQFQEAFSYKVWLAAFTHSLADVRLRTGRATEARFQLEKTRTQLTAIEGDEAQEQIVSVLLDRINDMLEQVILHTEQSQQKLPSR